jgi:hypothetical protein
MAREFRKTLSYSDLATFLEDQELYIERITSPRKPWEHLHQLVGETVHAMAAADDRARDRILDRRLAEVPEEEKEAARSKIMQMIETADALATPAEKTSQEEQLSWKDPVTGWILKAKPDEISMLEKGRLMQISDLKTASRLKYKHKSQLFFFGLVAALAKNYQGPIRLVVKLLGSGLEESFWYSPKATERSLEGIRATIARIEALLIERGILPPEQTGSAQ